MHSKARPYSKSLPLHNAPCIVEGWSEEKSEMPDGSGEGGGSQPSENEAEAPAEGAGAVQVAKVKAKPKDLSAQLKKEHVNIVFIGHVDAGKSTIGGRVL